MNWAMGELLSAPDETYPVDRPIRGIRGGAEEVPEQGIALCMSGGGYRAMLFHTGVLWRLSDEGMLPRLNRVSSVSGGSITAGVLAMNWGRLAFDAQGVAAQFARQVVEPLRKMASRQVDVTSVLLGISLPFTSISDRVVKAYRRYLFGKTTLQDLPEAPRFVINATNLESGVLMRFTRPYLADYRVGRVPNPDLPLAVAVAASSAFPPFLSPFTVDLTHEAWVTDKGNDLATPEFRGEIRLSDGGVYDNLGLETAWKRYSTILVSDAGGRMGANANPPGDWPRHMLRVLQVADNQVRSLRKRQVIEAFRTGTRTGMYVSIRSDPARYPVPDPILVDPKVPKQLAAVPTRLDALADALQERLINWGYAICDAGLRAHVVPGRPAGRLPYPDQRLDQQWP